MANPPTTPVSSQLFGDLNFHDYLAIAKRRLFWIVLPAIGVLIATAIVAWRLPDVYRCETTILVDPQKVPESYIKSSVTSGIADRLSTIQEQVTSPAELKKLIDTMGLYPELRKRIGEQEIIRVMQQSIGVEPVSSLGSQFNAFRITFRGKNPVEAAQVANQIAAMFIAENLKAREQQSYGTADFLESELQKTSQQLQQKEGELGALRSQYMEDLPESEQYHVQQAESLRMQVRSIDEQVSRDEQEKVYLQSVMASASPTVDMDLGAGTSPYQSQVENLQTKLNTLRSRYGPAHPDVRRLEAQLQQLKAKIVPAPDNSATASPVARQSHNPVVEAQLEKLDEDIAKQKASAAKVQNDIDFHISKIQREPIFWEKTAGVTRDYDTLRARYTSLLDKKLAADTASAMESRQKSERFVILDPAQVPEKPYSPNRPLLFLGGLIGGVLIGIGVVVVMEIMDESVRDGRQAERILGKPVLTGIPEILTSQQQWNGRVRLCAASLTTVVTAVILGLGIAHFSVRFF
jgi:polysaccharide chain length determinant protein (PEP-CTERM system associated)